MCSRRTRSVAACTWLVCSAAVAQEQEQAAYSFKGHYKNLLVDSRTVTPEVEGYTLDLNRLRLELRGRPVEWFGYEVQYDHEAWLGSYLDTAHFAQTKATKPTTAWDLEDTYLDRGAVYARHRLYRVFASLTSGPTDLKLGRQRIAWGSGRLWNPTDILNPYSPTQIERAERPGVDALLVERNLGALSRFGLVYAFPAASSGASAALNYRRNVAGTDVTLLVGDFRGDRVVGLDLASRLGDAGLYAEAAHTRPALGTEYTRATLGAEYAFPNTLTVGAEYYYNGQGTRERAGYDFTSLFAGKVLNVARRYVGAHLKYEFTPLLRSENYLIANLDDGSRFFAPSLVYSVTADWDWAVGAQFFAGGADAEYGRFHDVYYTYVQWFF